MKFTSGGVTYLWEDCTIGFICPTCGAELVADSQNGECGCKCGLVYSLSAELKLSKVSEGTMKGA